MMDKADYVVMIVLCCITGALSCILGGVPAIIYGAILSTGLAAVIPFIDHMKRRGTWNIKRQVIAGGIAGLIIGLILLPIENLLQRAPVLSSSAWEHTTAILLLAPIAYGIMVHLAYALYYRYQPNRLVFFTLIYVGFALGGFIGLLPLVFSPEILLLIFFAPWFNNLLIALTWALIVRFVDQVPKVKIKKKYWGLLALFLLAIPGCESMIGMHMGYKNAQFKNNNQNNALLAKTSGIIYTQDGGLCLPDKSHTANVSCDYKDYFPDSPTGDKAVSLTSTKSDPEQPYKSDNIFTLSITDKKSGKKLLEKQDTYCIDCGTCWYPDGNSLVAVKKSDEKYILQRIFLDGKVEDLGNGTYPRLAEKTGDIAFVNDGWLYIRKAGTGQIEKKCRLSLLPDKYKGEIVDYDISPDGKMIAVAVVPNTRHRYIYFVTIYSLEENVPGYVLCETYIRSPLHWIENPNKTKPPKEKKNETD